MEFFDSHSHYNDEQFNDNLEEIINYTYKESVTKFICAGYDLNSSKKSLEISEKYSFIYSICGISPNDIDDNEFKNEEMLKDLEEIIKSEIEKSKTKLVAIGEIGLDYHWNKENKDLQKMMFIKQIELANKYNLPIVIHTREAVEDTITILKENKVKSFGVFHCCPLNSYLVSEALKLGFYISFAGPVTFKNSKNADEIINMVPIERVLIETDSPYLAPEPVRGTRNNCTNVKYVAKKIAEVKNLSIEEVASVTYNNALEIFRI